MSQSQPHEEIQVMEMGQWRFADGTDSLSKLSEIDPDWERKIFNLIELHEKGGLNRVNPWDEVVEISHRVIEINDVLLETDHRPHLDVARRFLYAVVGLHNSRVTTLRDDVVQSIERLIAITSTAADEADKPGRAKRAQDRKYDDDYCPTNADPKSISLPDADVTGGPLFHTTEPDRDSNKIAALHLFNLPVYGGADVAYDLSVNPAQAVAAYEEVLGQELPRLEGLLPLLRAAADAPLEVEALEPWLPDPTEEALAEHEEFMELIEAEGARQLRLIRQRRQGCSDGAAASASGGVHQSGADGAQPRTSVDADGAAAEPLQDVRADDGGSGYDFGDAGGEWGAADDGGDVPAGFDPAMSGGSQRSGSAGVADGGAATGAPQAGGDGDVRSELAWLLQGDVQNKPLSWARPEYWRFHAPPGARKEPNDKPARKASATRKVADAPPPSSLEDPRFEMATKSTCMSEATRRKRAARRCAQQPSYGIRCQDSLLLLGKHRCTVDANFKDLHKVERRPGLAAEGSAAMHGGEGFGDVWADDRVDDGGDAWDDGGGDFAGYAAGESADDVAAGSCMPWEAQEPLGAGGLTPLAGGLVPAPQRRPRVQAKFDLSSKHVDVHAVKKALWESYVHIESESCSVEPPTLGQRGRGVPEAAPEPSVAGRHVELQAVFEDGAAPCSHPSKLQVDMDKASVHVKFICMLHIANEQGLALQGVPEMDKVVITRQAG